MKGNSISLKMLNESGKLWLEKSLQLLKVQEYGKGSVRNYMQELTLLFKHYNELQVEDLKQELQAYKAKEEPVRTIGFNINDE